MKTIQRIFKFIVLILLLPACSIIENIEDITFNANQILEELADLSQIVTSAVESGELEEQIGNMVDDQIEELSKTINEMIQENGGFIFDEVNGTLDNTFDNIGGLIADIKTGILDESIPQNIELLSSHLERQTNNVAAHAENLINLTFGNTALIISQATDAAFTLTVWAVFGVGIILFVLFLIIWGSKMSKFIRSIVLGLMALFMIICLSVLFIPPVKGFVLKSLNIGEELIAKSITPKIVSASPDDFEFGTNKQLILFGTHLEKLHRDSIEIALYQGGNKKLVFPNNTIKVISTNKIILSDFANSSLNWKKISYPTFKNVYRATTQKSLPINYSNISTTLNKKHLMAKPAILKMINRHALTAGSATILQPHTTSSTIQPGIVKPNISKAIKTAISPQFSIDYGKILLNNFKIKPGDYEIKVMHKSTGKSYSNIQHVKFENPPPPPPKPDIFPISINWANGVPVKGSKGKLKLQLGVMHGEEARNNMKVDLTANPSITSLRGIDVSRTAIQNANSHLTIYSRAFTVNQAGNINFATHSDVTNKISESNENNNTKTQNLRVKDYKFTASLKLHTFVALNDLDGWGDDEYRMSFTVTATGNSHQKFNFNKDGKANKNYAINKTILYNNLKEGDQITITASGYESGSWPDGTDNMGSRFKKLDIRNETRKTISIELKATHFKILGELTYNKIVIN